MTEDESTLRNRVLQSMFARTKKTSQSSEAEKEDGELTETIERTNQVKYSASRMFINYNFSVLGHLLDHVLSMFLGGLGNVGVGKGGLVSSENIGGILVTKVHFDLVLGL